jgi:phage gpG-like protein
MSRRVRRGGGKTMIDTGRLKNSHVAAVLDPRTLSIGTNVKYARPLYLGFHGTVQIPQHLRRVTSRDVRMPMRRVSRKTGRAYTAAVQVASGFAVVRAHTARRNLPARNPLVVQPEDLMILVAMAEQHLAREQR